MLLRRPCSRSGLCYYEVGGDMSRNDGGVEMITPPEDFVVIGDGETVALDSGQSSIDWLCLVEIAASRCTMVIPRS